MRMFVAVAAAAALACSGAKAAEINLSHFGEVMESVPWAIAFKKHMFQDAGVDVTGALTSQGGGSTLRNMLAGSVPFGEVSTEATVTAIKAGLPVKIVGLGTNNAADNTWVVLPKSPIHSFHDLVGKKFGTTHPGGVTRAFGEMLLKHYGIKPDQITQVPLGVGVSVAALDSGAVDTTYMLEPLRSKYGDKYRDIGGISIVLPSVAQLFLVTSDQFIKEHPDKLRAILKVHKETVDFIEAHPKEAADLALPYMVNISKEALEKATVRLAKVHYWSDGTIDPAALEGTRKLLVALGAIKPSYDFSKVIDKRFLPK
jgi:NitT/TauT family transport system substrate-binding protein